MGMPQGFKSENGYATVTDSGKGYREIAEYMTENGFKMNHSTARNVFLATMKKLAKEVCDLYSLEVSNDELTRVAADPRFQSGLYDIISNIDK